MPEHSCASFLIPTAVFASHQDAIRDILSANWEEDLPEVHMTRLQIDEARGGGFEEQQALQDAVIPFLNVWGAGSDGGYEAGACIFLPPQTGVLEALTFPGSEMPVVVVAEDGNPSPDELANARTYLATRARFYAWAAAGTPLPLPGGGAPALGKNASSLTG